MGLPPELAARLAARNLVTARDLFARTLLDLVELLDLPYETVRAILRDVAARIVPQPQSVRQAEQSCYRSVSAAEGGSAAGFAVRASVVLHFSWPPMLLATGTGAA